MTDQRFVDNGKIITSAGLSSHLVEKIRGRGRAKALALHMEYDWRPDSGFARAALADLRLPDIDFPAGVQLDPVDTGGSRDRWDASYRVSGAMSASQALDHADAQLAKLPGWKKAGSARTRGKRRTTWSFTDRQGEAWTCDTFLGAGEGGEPTLAFSLRRAGDARAATARPAAKRDAR